MFLAVSTLALFRNGTAGAANFAILFSRSNGNQKIECEELAVENQLLLENTPVPELVLTAQQSTSIRSARGLFAVQA
jgi:hypothetical protein